MDKHHLAALIVSAAYVIHEIGCYVLTRVRAEAERRGWRKWCEDNRLKLMRHDMVEALGERLASNGPFLFLQRLSLIAPLLGVLITAWGFYDLPAMALDDKAPTSILDTIKPLFVGVGLGAALAILNQFFLQAAAAHLSSVRKRGEKDLPGLLRSPTDDVLVELNKKLHDFSTDIESQLSTVSERTREQMDAVSNGVEAIGGAMSTVAERIERGGTTFQTAAKKVEKGLDASLGGLQKRLDQLGKDIEVTGRGVGTYVESARTDLERGATGLSEALVGAKSALTQAADAAGSIKDLAGDLKKERATQSEHLHATQDRLASLASVLEKDLVESLRTTATRMADASEDYRKLTKESVGVAGAFREASKDARAAIDATRTSIEGHGNLTRETADAVRTAAGQAQAAVLQLVKATQLLQEQSKATSARLSKIAAAPSQRPLRTGRDRGGGPLSWLGRFFGRRGRQ